MRLFPSLAFTLAALLMAGAAHASDPAEGEWLTTGGKGRVQISPCTNFPSRLCGKILWIYKNHTDAHNPDPRLRARAIVGIQFLSNFHNEGPGRWTGGTIYDPESGKTYNSLMSIRPSNVLEVKGCVLMFCQTQTWTRAR